MYFWQKINSIQRIKQTILDYKKERCYIGHIILAYFTTLLFYFVTVFISSVSFLFQYPIHLKILQDLFLQSSSSDYL